MQIKKLNRGGYLISTLKDGYIFKMRFFDYTKKEAIKLFRSELKKKEMI